MWEQKPFVANLNELPHITPYILKNVTVPQAICRYKK